ncbi:MAG: nuclear transport factor 2 family protein [Acidimicrobiales bacterium]|nr:nuclear transport factor 2 family protein [Acidimicrobiales bacterium]
MSEQDLDSFIETYRHALQSMVSGDPAPVLALFSSRDDVTLANPLGPPCQGPAAVAEATRLASANFRRGSMTFGEVSRCHTPELASVLEIELAQTELEGTGETQKIALRVTTIFRLEDAAWKIVHRHADPLTSARPVAAIVED